MSFSLPNYNPPNFGEERFLNTPNVTIKIVEKDGVVPEYYHATSIYPEYYKVEGKWILASESRMDCVVVVDDDLKLHIKEFRNIKKGDKVILGRTEDASEGIYVHYNGFLSNNASQEAFSFRAGRSRETAYSKDYDKLAEILKYEKDNGYIVWVLGPAAVFDHYSREALAQLIDNGYAHAIFGGNAVATHDLEGAILRTALGQDIYHQESRPNGHYNHIDVINKAREAGSIPELIEKANVKDGIIHACVKNDIPFVLAGSIRDDGPLPGVFSDVYKAQDAMRCHTRKATTVITLATMLHTIATGNMTPSYQVIDGEVRPVFIYTVDTSEFAVNKLMDRGTLEVKSIVTNVQDFLVKLRDRLMQE